MRKRFVLIFFFISMVLAACNTAPAEEEPTAQPTPTAEIVEPTLPPDGYPALPTAPAPASGYPAELADAWVIRPAGEQCAESVAYPTAESAVATLEAAGVTILAVEETELIVCEACGCPTSAHYRVLLSGEDLPTAFSMGWEVEN